MSRQTTVGDPQRYEIEQALHAALSRPLPQHTQADVVAAAIVDSIEAMLERHEKRHHGDGR
jgi:hypothetical protein